jgi:hypothetical protein
MLNVIILSLPKINVNMLSVIVLNVVILHVSMLCVIMLNKLNTWYQHAECNDAE